MITFITLNMKSPGLICDLSSQVADSLRGDGVTPLTPEKRKVSKKRGNASNLRRALCDNEMSNQTQSWAGLPEHMKRQAASEMLRGVQWHYYGRPVENPGEEELRRWIAPAAAATPFRSKPARARKDKPRRRFSTQEKRQVVKAALLKHPKASNRAIAAMTGTTHPFVARIRRMMETVTG